jgi:hypothetical protein
MRFTGIFILIASLLSLTGCSSLAHIMHMNGSLPHDNTWTQDIQAASQSAGFLVFYTNPYTVHLEIEETFSQEGIEQLNGDGGANAYAACLTLKVIF